jgi:hypothetical protein
MSTRTRLGYAFAADLEDGGDSESYLADLKDDLFEPEPRVVPVSLDFESTIDRTPRL